MWDRMLIQPLVGQSPIQTTDASSAVGNPTVSSQNRVVHWLKGGLESVFAAFRSGVNSFVEALSRGLDCFRSARPDPDVRNTAARGAAPALAAQGESHTPPDDAPLTDKQISVTVEVVAKRFKEVPELGDDLFRMSSDATRAIKDAVAQSCGQAGTTFLNGVVDAFLRENPNGGDAFLKFAPGRVALCNALQARLTAPGNALEDWVPADVKTLLGKVAALSIEEHLKVRRPADGVRRIVVLNALLLTFLAPKATVDMQGDPKVSADRKPVLKELGRLLQKLGNGGMSETNHAVQETLQKQLIDCITLAPADTAPGHPGNGSAVL